MAAPRPYTDVHAILAEETLVPVTWNTGATGLGRALDPSGDDVDLQRGAATDLPLWMVKNLAARNMLTLKMPGCYGAGMRRKLAVGAAVQDLRLRCPYYYDVAALLNEIVDMDDLGAFLMTTYRTRYKELLCKAHSCGEATPEMAALQQRLTVEEGTLFDAGRLSVAMFDAWRAKSLGRTVRDAPLKRKPASTAQQPGKAA